MVLYVITNLVNEKVYVGITSNVEQRRREHYSGHGSKLVYQAIQKYGKDKLDFEVWYEGDEGWIKMMEHRAILALESYAPHGYNLTYGGEGTKGWKPSEATLAKFRLRPNGMLGRKHSVETRRKLSEKAKQRECTPERAAHLRSLAGRGANNPNAKPVTLNGVQYGSIKDAATALGVSRPVIQRLRKAGLTTYTPYDRAAHGRKLGRMSRGRKRSDAIRAKMSESRQGAKHPSAKPVLVNGSQYGCLKDAASDQGVNYSTLRWRFQKWSRSGKFPTGYGYLPNSSKESNPNGPH